MTVFAIVLTLGVLGFVGLFLFVFLSSRYAKNPRDLERERLDAQRRYEEQLEARAQDAARGEVILYLPEGVWKEGDLAKVRQRLLNDDVLKERAERGEPWPVIRFVFNHPSISVSRVGCDVGARTLLAIHADLHQAFIRG